MEALPIAFECWRALPFLCNEPSDPAIKALNPQAPSDKQKPLHKVRVLVVEDDPDAQDILEIVLRAAGAIVTIVGSVPAAFAAIGASVPDVIISDIGLPGEDGFSFMTRLRAQPWGAAVPALALTAFTQAEHRDTALSVGYNAFLSKPVEPMRIVATLAALLGRTTS